MWRHRRSPPPWSNHAATTPQRPQRPRLRALGRIRTTRLGRRPSSLALVSSQATSTTAWPNPNSAISTLFTRTPFSLLAFQLQQPETVGRKRRVAADGGRQARSGTHESVTRPDKIIGL